MKKKLVLGTAQFGSNYGITNLSGKIRNNEIIKIFNFVKKKELNYFDTSQNYKNSEKVLSRLRLPAKKIITKINLSKINFDKNFEKEIEKKVLISIKNLKLKRIYGLLLQNIDKFFKNEGDKIYKALINLKKKKLFDKFGYSIYDFDNIDLICKKFSPDIVQCPFNIFDRRLLKKKNLRKLKEKKIEIHVRSVFLQGVLLSTEDKKIFKKFRKFEMKFKSLKKFNDSKKISNFEACLNFVKNYEDIDKVVVGFQNLKELKEIYNLKYNKKIIFPESLSSSNKNLIDPRYW